MNLEGGEGKAPRSQRSRDEAPAAEPSQPQRSRSFVEEEQQPGKDEQLAIKSVKVTELTEQVRLLEEHLGQARRDLIQSEESRMQEQRALLSKIQALRLQNSRLAGVVERVAERPLLPAAAGARNGQADEEAINLRREVASLRSQLHVLREAEKSHQSIQQALLENSELHQARILAVRQADVTSLKSFLWWHVLFWVVFLSVLITVLVYRPSAFTGFPSGATKMVERLVDTLKSRFG